MNALTRPQELHALRRHVPGELGPRQLAWLREKCPGFAEAERQWKASRGIEVS